MPIVFDEIKAEIVPDREPERHEQTNAPQAGQTNFAEQVHRELVLMQERAARLKAD